MAESGFKPNSLAPKPGLLVIIIIWSGIFFWLKNSTFSNLCFIWSFMTLNYSYFTLFSFLGFYTTISVFLLYLLFLGLFLLSMDQNSLFHLSLYIFLGWSCLFPQCHLTAFSWWYLIFQISGIISKRTDKSILLSSWFVYLITYWISLRCTQATQILHILN